MAQKRFRTTVTGSYPRPQQPGNTMKKPTLSRDEADEIIRWAVKDQVAAGLDTVTDGEGRRENMYYFFQKRLDGISFDQMEYRKYGPLGFGIDSAKVTGPIENPRFELARDWRVAREAAPPDVEVKLTLYRPAHACEVFQQRQTGSIFLRPRIGGSIRGGAAAGTGSSRARRLRTDSIR
jgi:5-methyltetrahydropteroyltriglutamate--homocysteine methyltransferase